jgi:hypothetical protein
MRLQSRDQFLKRARGVADGVESCHKFRSGFDPA